MMMRKLLLLLLITFHPFSFADNYDGTLDVFESSPDLKPYFDNAYGYAVFPTVGRGGIVVGGSYGKGQVYENGQVTGHVSLAKLSIGFQLGGQVFSEIIFLQDKRAFDEFISNRFEFDASASAVVVVLGAQARAGTTGSSASTALGSVSTNQVEYGYNKGMAVFLHSLGGLMYEASIGGQKFKYKPLEKDAQTQGL
jgi:lipid-binding SYLF domain-containing protein